MSRTKTSAPDNHFRLGGFYLFSVAIGGFANLLAYGLMQMEGVAGIRGWQWYATSMPEIHPGHTLTRYQDIHN